MKKTVKFSLGCILSFVILVIVGFVVFITNVTEGPAKIRQKVKDLLKIHS